MKKLKVMFMQTIMISAAILFGIGCQSLLNYFLYDVEKFSWPWYIPLSIILTGFLCSVPTVLLILDESKGGKLTIVRILIHFISVGAVVVLCGYLFKWYESIEELIPIIIMIVVIYVFVWLANLWLAKSNEKKINDAIKGIQDEE